MAEPLLVVEGLRVEYEDVVAVDDVSFTIEAGMVYGLIGPNGAGKTSIMRAVANLLEPTWGRILIEGVDLLLEPQRALRQVGFMPDFPPLYDDLTVFEFLELFASAYRLPLSSRTARIEGLLEQVQLTGKRDAPAGGLSRGMKQRLFLARTLLHDPKVLLLDEPASGLDPLARIELAEIIRSLGKAGKAVLVSSHILSEMADFCNGAGIMEQGRMRASGRIDALLERLSAGKALRVRLARPDARLRTFLEGCGGIEDLTATEVDAAFRFQGDDDDAAALLHNLVLQDIPVLEFREQVGSLQDIFLKVSSGRVS